MDKYELEAQAYRMKIKNAINLCDEVLEYTHDNLRKYRERQEKDPNNEVLALGIVVFEAQYDMIVSITKQLR